MKKILKYLKPFTKETILGPFFKLLEASFELLVPLIVALIINKGINANQDFDYVVKMCMLLILLGALGLFCSLIAQYYSAKAAVGFSAIIREQLFAKMQELSFNEIDELGTSSMITRITSDVNQVQSGINLFLRLFLRSPFIVFGALIMAFIVNKEAGIIFAIIISILLVIVFIILLVTKKYYEKVQQKLDTIVLNTKDNLRGARVIRAFCKEEKELEEYKMNLDSLNFLQKKAGTISSLLNPLTYVIINIGVILVIYLSSHQVYDGKLLQGDVIALNTYMTFILVELIKLANLIITISKAFASSRRISLVLDMQSSLESQEAILQKDKTYIEFSNISFKYKNASKETLTDISFKVKQGEIVGIIGGTGSGKTSLVNLIPHLYDSTGGNLYLEGKDIKSYDLKVLRQKIGFVPQRPVLFKGTIKSNLMWADKHASEKTMQEALEIAEAVKIVNEKENGLDSGVEQNGLNFSGGERQRLTIARALVRKPEILILDDSASALDYLTDAKIRKSIRSLKNLPTTFIVSQRTSSIINCDKIIVLDNGKVAGIGTHQELLEISPVYQEIHFSQFKKDFDYE